MQATSSFLSRHVLPFYTRSPHGGRRFLNSSSSSLSRVPLVSLIVIGNEVLSGQTKDKNIPTAINWCIKKGFRLHNVQIVPDNEQDIIRAIHQAQRTTTYTLTTGGIGPTHDDITYSSIAAAHNDTLSYHQPTVDKMFQQFGFSGLSLSPRLKMALLPTSAEILPIPKSWVPLVSMEESFVFPGIPRLFKSMLEVLGEHLEDGDKIVTYYVLTKKRESDIAEILEAEEREGGGEIEIGSYPNSDFTQFGEITYNVKISISTYNPKLGKEAQQRLVEALDGSPYDPEE